MKNFRIIRKVYFEQEVKAKNEKEALEKAYDNANWTLLSYNSIDEDKKNCEIEEVEI